MVALGLLGSSKGQHGHGVRGIQEDGTHGSVADPDLRECTARAWRRCSLALSLPDPLRAHAHAHAHLDGLRPLLHPQDKQDPGQGAVLLQALWRPGLQHTEESKTGSRDRDGRHSDTPAAGTPVFAAPSDQRQGRLSA